MATRAALIDAPHEAVSESNQLKKFLDAKIERSKEKPFTEPMVITPSLATLILAYYNEGNRRIYPAKLEQIVADMRAGRWRLNGETIIFSDGGHLNDGQHRIKAVEIVGTSQEFNIAFGFSADSITTIDTGKNRSTSDHLHFAGQNYAPQLAAITKQLLAFERAGEISLGRTGEISNAQAIERASRDELLQEIASWAGANNIKFRGLATASQVGFVYYATAQKNPAFAKTFMNKFMTGLDLKADDPIYAARSYLQCRPKSTQAQRIELLFRAWNAWIEEEKAPKLSVRGVLPELKG
jgi:hypothetical protein